MADLRDDPGLRAEIQVAVDEPTRRCRSRRDQDVCHPREDFTEEGGLASEVAGVVAVINKLIHKDARDGKYAAGLPRQPLCI
jgi:hypothetical protein